MQAPVHAWTVVRREGPRSANTDMGSLIAWSLELSAAGMLKAGSTTAPLLARLPAGTRIFLPALPADPPSAIEEAILLMRRENRELVAVPHIAASREQSVATLEKRLADWQRASSDNIREALIVRGDPHATHSTEGAPSSSAAGGAGGAFKTSLELLETNALQRCGLEAVSLCGHPEGVGGLSVDEARSALKAKLQWADAASLRARVVTQFCFDSAATTGFVDALRADGIRTDVSLGIVGPDCSMAIRQRMAARCGVAPPATPYVTPYMRWLAHWLEQRGDAGAQALHVYPFANLGATLRKLSDFSDDDSKRADGSRYASFTLDPPPPSSI